MNYATPDQRARLIAGLRDLAAFLEANPDVPAPRYTNVLVFPTQSSDAENHSEIDVIASCIGSGIEISSSHGHYVTSRKFGPVEYRAVAIPHDNDTDGELAR